MDPARTLIFGKMSAFEVVPAGRADVVVIVNDVKMTISSQSVGMVMKVVKSAVNRQILGIQPHCQKDQGSTA